MSKFSESIAYEDGNIYEAYWNFCRTGVMTLVLNKEDKFVGAVGLKEYERAMRLGGKCIADITNYSCTVIRGDNLYEQARNIYADKDIEWLPVLDEEGKLVDVFSRKRALYKQYFKSKNLPYLHYASSVWAAVNEAQRLGLKKISVIEFGVAGGNGLLALEFHAREIERIFGVEVEVYGFDTGEGLPEYEEDYKDALHWFYKGTYKMDFSRLKGKLERAKLILGDVHATGSQFWEMNPAPIGAMMIDVDFYTSTVPILHMLETDSKNVLPRIYMYFDDIFRGFENTGENQAIREFNERNKGNISISPEGTNKGYEPVLTAYPVYEWKPDIKVCHYFKHPLYNINLVKEMEAEAPLRPFVM